MKIGVLVPFTNTNIEADMIRMRPKGSSIHFTRIGGYDLNLIPDGDQMVAMGETDISEPLRLIAAVSPDVILYGCTSATLSHGLDFDKRLKESIATITGAFAITAAGALIEALSALKITKIGFASPYVQNVNDLAIEFLSDAGFETVARAESDKPLSSIEQGALTPDNVYTLALQADSPETEAIVLSCTDLRAVEIVERLEAKTGKPVVTSNQAMMFALSRVFTEFDYGSCPGTLFKQR
ncbi:MAG: maleate isomerase [Polaribacter sp.]|jgi:maleate isomerase